MIAPVKRAMCIEIHTNGILSGDLTLGFILKPHSMHRTAPSATDPATRTLFIELVKKISVAPATIDYDRNLAAD